MEEIVKIPSEEEEVGFLRAMGLQSGIAVVMVSRAAIDLGVFEIIAKGGEGAKLSAEEIADSLPTQNPNTTFMLERMLKFLANHSILRCTLTQDHHCSYSLTPISKNFVPNQDGVSLSAMLQLITHKAFVNSWYALKDVVLEGGVPFNRTHAFENPGKDSRYKEVVNKAMYDHSAIAMKRVVECYKGFEAAKEVVDVGGGFGASLSCIVSKYPNIKGINFDLPHVINEAPAIPGVEHIPGDMFESVPCGEIIFMKWIVHCWDDEHCLKLLKNCRKALPECGGKVVLVESILPEHPPEKDAGEYDNAFYVDILMMTMNRGGKGRTHTEFEALAKEAGFSALKLICPVHTEWVIELYK